MWGVSTTAGKQRIRGEVLRLRRTLPISDAQCWSRAIQAKALELQPYLAADSVALYNPIENEARTEAIHKHALEAGKQVFYPRIEPDKSLDLIQVSSAAEFRPGPLGILEPVGNVRWAGTAADDRLVFVPGLAFDLQGNRLGHGKGYYDALLWRLAGSTICAGLAYECQIIEKVPTDQWDQRVHFIVTERRVIDCASMAQALS